jgi:hypothetical protein
VAAWLAGSLAFIAVGALALLFGWLKAESGLLWVSIAASVVAALLIAVAYWLGANGDS